MVLNSTNTSYSLPIGNFSNVTSQNFTNNTINPTVFDVLINNITNLTTTKPGRPKRSSFLCLIEDEEDDGTKAVKTLAYIIVFLASAFGNSLIMAVIALNRRMHTPVNFFILNMALSDLLVTVFFMPRMFSRIFYGLAWQVTGTAGLILCKISPSMQEFCSSLSVLLFMAISVDRFLAVVFPLKKIITKKVAIIMLIGIWFFTLAIRIPTFYGFKLRTLRGKYYCVSVLEDPVADEIYKQSAFAVFYAVPLCIVVVLYSAVIIALKKRKRPGATSQTQANVQLKRTHRILKMLVTVVISFSVCWFLYFCLPVLSKYMDYQDVTCNLLFPMFFFSHLYCAFNPMVYLLYIESYRRAARDMLYFCCPRRNAVGPAYDERSTSEMRNVRRGRSSTVELDKTYGIESTESPMQELPKDC